MIMHKPQTSVWGLKDKSTVASERRFMVLKIMYRIADLSYNEKDLT